MYSRTYRVASKMATGSEQVQLGLAETGDEEMGTAMGAMGLSIVVPAADVADLDVYDQVTLTLRKG